ncbi:hypothetical protein ALC53_03403, partial [Atta colombica]
NDGTMSPCGATYSSGVLMGVILPPSHTTSFKKLNNHDSSQKPITFSDLDTILPMRAEDITREVDFQQPGRAGRSIYQLAPLPMVISNHWCH